MTAPMYEPLIALMTLISALAAAALVAAWAGNRVHEWLRRERE